MRARSSSVVLSALGLGLSWGALLAPVGCSSSEGPVTEEGDARNDGDIVIDSSVDQTQPRDDGGVTDAGSEGGGGPAYVCTPTADHPCVKKVWSGQSARTICAQIDKVDEQGILECWGETGIPLGLDGGMTDAGDPVAVVYTPHRFPLEHVKQMSIGFGHVCTIEWDAGGVRCWGGGSNGQLGNGQSDSLLTPPVDSVLEGAEEVGVSPDSHFSCARQTNGTVQCWGENGFGQLGQGTSGPSQSLVPLPIPGFSAAQLLVADDLACALRTGDPNGELWCWGFYPFSLSHPRFSVPTVPDAGPPANGVKQIAIASNALCTLLKGGTVSCSGNNLNAQLASDPTSATGIDFSETPLDVGLTNVVQIVGANATFCARLASGKVMCWGYATSGQCGVDPNSPSLVTAPGSPNPRLVVTPTEVTGITNAVDLVLTGATSCAILAEGTLKCWGSFGTLGSAPSQVGMQYSFVPVSVTDWE